MDPVIIAYMNGSESSKWQKLKRIFIMYELKVLVNKRAQFQCSYIVGVAAAANCKSENEEGRSYF